MYDIANCIKKFRENLIYIVSMPHKIECVSRCLGISMSDLIIFVTEIKYMMVLVGSWYPTKLPN